MRPDLTKQCAR